MLDLSPSFHFTGAQFVHVSKRWNYSTHILTHNPYRAQRQASHRILTLFKFKVKQECHVTDHCSKCAVGNGPVLTQPFATEPKHSVRFIQHNLIHPNTFSFC